MLPTTHQPIALLTLRQAAAYMGLSVHTLRQWVSQRRIPFVKLGRAVRFNPADLAAFITAHTRPVERDGDARHGAR